MSDRLLYRCSRSALWAGPLVILLYLIIASQDAAGAVLPIEPQLLPMFAVALLVSVPVGIIVAFPSALALGWLLSRLAARWWPFRPTVTWVAGGAGSVVGLARLLGDIEPQQSLPWSITAAACAFYVRWGLSEDDLHSTDAPSSR